MFTTIRRIHLYAGAVLLTFVGMYFVTGFVMINDQLFPHAKLTVTTHRQSIPAKPADLSTTDPAAVGRFIQKSLGLSGAIRPGRSLPTQPGKPWQFNFIHPGCVTQVTVPTTQPYSQVELSIRQSVTSTKTDTANALHHFHGYGGGWQYDLWAIAADAAAVAMILFAMTGIYLWWKLSKVRWPGMLILAGSLAFTVATWWYLIVMP